jgi:hypothetical protein
VNIPANAPHMFKNTSGSTVHMHCMCTPAGKEEFFMEVGDLLESHISPPPKLDSLSAVGCSDNIRQDVDMETVRVNYHF